MGRISDAIHNLHHLDYLADRDNPLTRIHPLSKLIVTLCYVAMVVSFSGYNLSGVLSMAIYLFIGFEMAGLSLVKSMKKVRLIIPLLIALGITNLWFDQRITGNIGSFKITGGMISLLTLVLKGTFTVLASYLFIATTSIGNLCYALKVLRCPGIIITLVLLIYRYIIVLLKEVERITTAYNMRAPDQKGLHFRVWGSLVGQLLLRSIDRAQEVYESMTMRGYDGLMFYPKGEFAVKRSVVYTFGWVFALLLLRAVPLFEIIGRLLTKM